MEGEENTFTVSLASENLKKMLADDEYTPISLLIEGGMNSQISGRVLAKTEMKIYSTPSKTSNQQGGVGKFFKITIADRTKKIDGVFWANTAERYYEYIKVNHVYMFNGGDIKKGPGGRSLEIHFSPSSEIVEVADSGRLPRHFYDFLPLKEVKEKDLQSQWDVVGAVARVGGTEQIQLKSGDRKTKRTLYIFDESEQELEVSLWGDEWADIDSLKAKDLIAFSNLKLGEYRGQKTLSNTNGTVRIWEIPSTGRVRELKKWLDEEFTEDYIKGVGARGTNSHFVGGKILTAIRDMRTIAERDLRVEGGEKLLFCCVAYVTALPTGIVEGQQRSVVNSNYYYPKCPVDNCLLKVFQEDGDGVVCTVHGHMKDKEFVPRFIGGCRICDHTEEQFVKYSDLSGYSLFGIHASELLKMEKTDMDAFKQYVRERLNTPYVLTLSCKKETYEGNTRLIFSIVDAQRIKSNNVREVNKSLFSTISQHAKTVK